MTAAPDCPFCGSGAVERVGQWGGQIITAQWQCEACNSYFEAVRDDFASVADTDGAGPARITLRRRIEWIDTDAAGIWHWTAVCRLAEAAEAALHTALRIEKRTFGVTPRVAVNFEFRRSLRFNDRVEVTLAVEDVGRSSVRYGVVVIGPDGVAAEGQISACLIDRSTGRATAWPPELRTALAEGGEQHPLA